MADHVTMKTLQWSSEKGRDVATDLGVIKFVPRLYMSPQYAARKFHMALQTYAAGLGYNPENVHFFDKRNPGYAGGVPCVSWEEGPFMWGTLLSDTVENSPHWYTEPHYNFDLTFVLA